MSALIGIRTSESGTDFSGTDFQSVSEKKPGSNNGLQIRSRLQIRSTIQIRATLLSSPLLSLFPLYLYPSEPCRPIK